MNTHDFIRLSAAQGACGEGHEAARCASLPNIPDRWSAPELRSAWIAGYLTELRNRLEDDPHT